MQVSPYLPRACLPLILHGMTYDAPNTSIDSRSSKLSTFCSIVGPAAARISASLPAHWTTTSHAVRMRAALNAGETPLRMVRQCALLGPVKILGPPRNCKKVNISGRIMHEHDSQCIICDALGGVHAAYAMQLCNPFHRIRGKIPASKETKSMQAACMLSALLANLTGSSRVYMKRNLSSILLRTT